MELSEKVSSDSEREARGKTKKRRRVQKRPRSGSKSKKPKKKKTNSGSEEVFDIDGVGSDEDEEDEDDTASHQLGYYKGEKKTLMKQAILFVRLFLLNMDAHPEKDQLVSWAHKAYMAACQLIYGLRYEGALIRVRDMFETHTVQFPWI